MCPPMASLDGHGLKSASGDLLKTISAFHSNGEDNMMRSKLCLIASLAMVWLSAASVCLAAETAKAPLAQFPTSRYEFQGVVDGTKIIHEFVIQNKGTAPLAVENVKTS
jgi:hypothetical protein